MPCSARALAACSALNCASSLEKIPPAYTGSVLPVPLLLPVELLPPPVVVVVATAGPLPLVPLELVPAVAVDDVAVVAASGALNFDIKEAILRSSEIIISLIEMYNFGA